MKVTIDWEANGSLVISNDRSRITVQPDGTIAISSEDSIQLTGASLAKLDNVPSINGDKLNPFVVQRVIDALTRRIEKKH